MENACTIDLRITCLGMPCEHLLPEHLVEGLPEEIVQGDIGIGADRPVRMTEYFLVALPARHVTGWTEGLAVVLGVFPLDQQQILAATSVPIQHRSISG